MISRPNPASGLSAAALLAACGLLQASPAMAASQDALPAAVQVPAGHKVAWETVGRGEITYECRAKADVKDQMEWVFAGPKAVLRDRQGKQVGTYYGPPATWEAADGSKLTGTQVAVAPAGPGNLPYQLVKANPAVGAGTLTGVAYIQRTALKGGVAPQAPCTTAGQRSQVSYEADYIFWKAD